MVFHIINALKELFIYSSDTSMHIVKHSPFAKSMFLNHGIMYEEDAPFHLDILFKYHQIQRLSCLKPLFYISINFIWNIFVMVSWPP